MIRIYQRTGAKIELLDRIDWELPVSHRHTEQDPSWIDNEQDMKDARHVLDVDQVDAVVIKDLCKGVISRALISWLSRHFRTKPWFVSTKAWHPTWLDELANVKLRLFVVPQVPAQTAIRDGALGCWLTRSGRPSREALELLKGIHDTIGSRDFRTTFVALPQGSSILAYDCQPGKTPMGHVQTDPNPRPLAISVAMASVLYPAMVALLLDQERSGVVTDTAGLLRRALGFTHDWMAYEAGRITAPEGWNPNAETFLDVDAASSTTTGTWPSPFTWTAATKDWERASEKYGVIEQDGTKRIELWRAMTDVEGYVCCVRSKRQVIRAIVKALDGFVRGYRRENLSCMLTSPPGSGKTYLIRQLAKAFRLRFLPFNITQMLSRSDILDCFDTIVTTQAHASDEPVLVFVDEINGPIDGEFVFDAFLGPLQEGTYVRAGKTFYIKPCAWVFAGTQKPALESGTSFDKARKVSDFESRLSLEPLTLEASDAERDEDRLEKVYLGVSLLRTVFPDVRFVSERVLHLFHGLPRKFGIRDIEHLVRFFNDVQYGKVHSRNVPKDRLEKIKEFDVTQWESHPEGEQVEIVS